MTTANPRYEILAVTICVSVFLTVWTGVVYIPSVLQSIALSGSSGAWYALGWLASAASAVVAWAIVYRKRR